MPSAGFPWQCNPLQTATKSLKTHLLVIKTGENPLMENPVPEISPAEGRGGGVSSKVWGLRVFFRNYRGLSPMVVELKSIRDQFSHNSMIMNF